MSENTTPVSETKPKPVAKPTAPEHDSPKGPEQEPAVPATPEQLLVKFRAPHEAILENGNRAAFTTGQVISSFHFNVDHILRQGAQLDLVEIEDGEHHTILDLNAV